MRKEFLNEGYLQAVGFALNEEDDSWRKDGYAVSINDKNECLFFIENPEEPEKLIEIKGFSFRDELDELWKIIKGERLVVCYPKRTHGDNCNNLYSACEDCVGEFDEWMKKDEYDVQLIKFCTWKQAT